MVLSSLTSEQGQPTGLSLACSSTAITEALQQPSKSRDAHHNSGVVIIIAWMHGPYDTHKNLVCMLDLRCYECTNDACVLIFSVADFLKRRSSYITYIDELEKFVVLITTRAGWGTGIQLTPSLVLTCSHVVQSKQGWQFVTYCVVWWLDVTREGGTLHYVMCLILEMECGE